LKIILSIDGGGIKGIIAAIILSYLEEKIQDVTNDNRIKIGDLIDFVAGTSTGSIIGALMLVPDDEGTHPRYKMSEIADFYLSLGDKVFKQNLLHDLSTLWGLFGPKFPTTNIEAPLIKKFSGYKLKDLVKPCMFTGYDIEKRKVVFFTNNDQTQKYINYYVKDVVRGSTAIPSYFTPAYFNDGVNTNTIIDGGLFANNPSFAAFIETSKTLSANHSFDPASILIISIGTGCINKKSYTFKKVMRWGKAKWVVPLFEILLSANSEVTDYEIKKLFSSYNSLHNYKRLNPPIILGSSDSLNASKKNLINLIKDTNKYIDENKTMLDTLAREIYDINFMFKNTSFTV
jgi:uncharacterized protein